MARILISAFLLIATLVNCAVADDAENLQWLMRNLTEQDRAAIALKDGEESLIPQIVSEIESGNDLFDLMQSAKQGRDAVMRAALAATQQGRITFDELISNILIWQDLEDLGSTPFTSERRLIEETDEIFDTTAAHRFMAQYTRSSDIIAALSQWERPSQRYYRIYRLKKSDSPGTWFYGTHALIRVNEERLEAFMPKPNVRNRDEEIYATQPAAYFNVQLQVGFGQRSLRPLWELGITNYDQIMEGLTQGGRVMMLSFPGVQALTEIHEADFGRRFATGHDWYHLHLAQNTARNPRGDGVATIKLYGHIGHMLMNYLQHLDSGGAPISLAGFNLFEGDTYLGRTTAHRHIKSIVEYIADFEGGVGPAPLNQYSEFGMVGLILIDYLRDSSPYPDGFISRLRETMRPSIQWMTANELPETEIDETIDRIINAAQALVCEEKLKPL